MKKIEEPHVRNPVHLCPNTSKAMGRRPGKCSEVEKGNHERGPRPVFIFEERIGRKAGTLKHEGSP